MNSIFFLIILNLVKLDLVAIFVKYIASVVPLIFVQKIYFEIKWFYLHQVS